MRDGFIKVAAACPDIRVADTDFNCEAIIACMKEADKYGVKVLCFPELCVTSSTCDDLFGSSVLLEGASAALEKIRTVSSNFDMLTVVGSPIKLGGRIYNCFIAVSKGAYLGAVPVNSTEKSRLFSSYGGENTECRYGVFGNKFIFACNSMPEFTVGFETEAKTPAAIILSPSAHPEFAGAARKRRNKICADSERLAAGYVYCGAGGGESTTDYAFSGHRLIAESGTLLGESVLFGDETLLISEIDVKYLETLRRECKYTPNEYDTISFDMSESETVLTRKISKTPFAPEDAGEKTEYLDTILAIQSAGLKKRLLHTGAFKMIVGVSGGRDSALTLIACANTADIIKRPRTDVIGISMPCFGTTDKTKSAASSLCKALGVTFMEIDIGKSVESHLSDIDHDIDNHNTTYENSQARERTQVLMDYANDVNGIVVGTGDLSELALGWATYNGDHMAMYGVNAGVPKTLIEDLIRHYAKKSNNAELETAIDKILTSPISPELLPADGSDITQITEDIVGPYILHDFFIFHSFAGFSPKKIFRLACHAFGDDFPKDVILKWLKNYYTRFFMSQFKRSCSPDGAGAMCISLSPRGGLVMPSDAVAKLWLDDIVR